jgi:hypothetical protein
MWWPLRRCQSGLNRAGSFHSHALRRPSSFPRLPQPSPPVPPPVPWSPKPRQVWQFSPKWLSLLRRPRPPSWSSRLRYLAQHQLPFHPPSQFPMKSRLAQLNHRQKRSSRQPVLPCRPQHLRPLPNLSSPLKFLLHPHRWPSSQRFLQFRPLKRSSRPSQRLTLLFQQLKRNPLFRPLLPRRVEARVTHTPHPLLRLCRLAVWSCHRPVRALSTKPPMCLPPLPLPRQPATRQPAPGFSVASPSSIATGPQALPAVTPSAQVAAHLDPASSRAARVPSILHAPHPAATPELARPVRPAHVPDLPRDQVLLHGRAASAALHVQGALRRQQARLRARPALHPGAVVAVAASSIPKPKKAR